jgi:hypothetical protein
MKNEELDHIIEKSFKTEPDFHLPANFAGMLTLSVIRREQWKTDLREYLYQTTVLAFLLALVSVIYYFIDKEIVVRVFTYITSNALAVVFIVFILNFILFADRVLLRLLFRRWNRTEV